MSRRTFAGAIRTWSRAGRGPRAPRRWYYVTLVAANGEVESSVRYRTRAGRNKAAARLKAAHPRRALEREGPIDSKP